MNKENSCIAYVDGSYKEGTKEYSGAVVFLYNENIICFSKKGNNRELAKMRNVAGEILGAKLAMEKAIEMGIDHLTIVHDYQGISSWCLGEWKTTKEGTKDYKKYYDSLKGTIEVIFRKVKGHSGNKYNDLADKLAKDALKEG